MRITSVNIPAEVAGNGLSDIRMSKLGQIVILAGKNGAGKTRILQLISNFLGGKPGIPTLNMANNEIRKLNNHVLNCYSEMKVNPSRRGFLLNEIKNAQVRIDDFKKLLGWDYITTSEMAEKYIGVKYVPYSNGLQDPNNQSKRDVIEQASSASRIGTDHLIHATLSKIQLTQDRWNEATHPHSDIDADVKEKAIEDYDKLREIIRVILKTDISRNIDGDVKIFGLRLGAANLSSGQSILLQYCVALHSQGASLDNSILFFDEPENSLHPAAVIETIERIRECIPNGQIWISTHSLSILAHFDPNCIWYVEDGKVSHAGKTPEKVLESLLGDENERGRLADFLNLPAIYALNMHAYESLFHPEAVETGKDDPQTLQINDEIKAHLQDKDKIRILDFGAGKGRLLANIIENNNQPKEEFTKWFDYVAYDPYDTDKENCLSVLRRIYEDADNRYFNDINKIFEKRDKNSFDVVIMCNVLHEIDPKDWLNTFSDNKAIPNLLRENGILLLVEDHEMPVGEKAYQKGYIVLDTVELKELFSVKGELPFNDARGDGRLKAHRITRNQLIQINKDTRIKALESLHNKAKDKVLAVRNKELNYANGKKHGFWLQQYANTGLALSELEG